MSPRRSRKPEILVIEDHPGDVRLMQEAVRDFPAQLTLRFVSDGEAALQYLSGEGQFQGTRLPSLIFLDLNLPKIGARELIRQIKHNPDFRAIPLIVFTTSDAEKDVKDAYELYANCYLCKPVDLDDFISAVRTTIHFWLNVASIPVE